MNQRNMTASNPHVQETITRFIANQDIDSDFLHRSEVRLMKAVFMEVFENVDWTPTYHIEALLIDINVRLKYWEERQPN